MWNKYDDDLEEGEYANLPEDRPSLEEIKAAVEIIVFIEYELEINIKRLRVRVREKSVFIQGSVENHDQKKAIEGSVPLRPNVASVETNISVQKII